MQRDKLFADTARRQRAHQRHHYWQVLFTARQALAYQVVWRDRQVALFQSNIGAEAVEEGQLEVGCLTQRAVRAHLDTVATEDAAIECECIARQVAFRHHQGSRGADLDARAAGDAVGIMQADVEGCGDNRVESFPEHTVAVGPDYVMT